MKKYGILSVIFALIFFTNILLVCNVEACKDIIACGDATAGDYNLLLKVRDPTRLGLQVLSIVPEGHEYTYNHPWTGESMKFQVKHKFIQGTTKGDTVPNIVKPAMALSSSGIAYGDADSNSKWKNPTKYAWDDFDWIRYACQEADDENQAVDLMTKDVVDDLHASGVSENLFVVGPEKGFVIEADVYNYKVKEINDGAIAMSNYPKELWRTQVRKKLPIASSFDITKEQYVRKGRTLRLNSLYGVRIKDVGENQIVAQQVPFFKIVNKKIIIMGTPVTIKLGERETVGDFSVELLDIDGKKAKIKMCNKYKAWEDIMMGYIQSRYGSIDVSDIIYWSRLHGEDVDGLISMCGNAPYESAAIYKIPKDNYGIMGSGWFAANRPCSSIYVPFHISNTDIYDPYETGEASAVSLELLEAYGHDVLNDYFGRAETVFLYENEASEDIATGVIEDNMDVSNFLTIVDTNMQKQALLTEELWLEASKISDNKLKQNIIDYIEDIWYENYTLSMNRMKIILPNIKKISGSDFFVDRIEDIALNICKLKIDASNSIGKQSPTAEVEYLFGRELIKQGEYEFGFAFIEKAFKESDMLMKGEPLPELDLTKTVKNIEIFLLLYVLIILLIVVFLVLLLKKKRN